MPRGISQPPPIRKPGFAGGGTGKLSPWMLVLGVAAIGGLWYLHAQSATSSSASGTSANNPATLSSITNQAANTDIQSNLPIEDTWPYNQLSLPFNFNGEGDSTVLNNNSSLNPQDTSFVGYQQTSV